LRTLKEWPDPDDYVICTISELNPNSAVAVLDEYNGKKGMIHVSEVANTMVRDIRRFVKIGEKEVAKVLFVDSERGYVGLSLKRVKPSIQREKILEFKNENKADKCLTFAAKVMKKTIKEAYDEAGYILMEKYGGFILLLSAQRPKARSAHKRRNFSSMGRGYCRRCREKHKGKRSCEEFDIVCFYIRS